MEEGRTTAAVHQYLNDLAHVRADSEAEPIVRELLARAVDRLHLLCARLLHRNYPRLTRGPLNLGSEELLGAVVERLLKAMRDVRPPTVRQFFALANQHIRWELNDLARRLDQQAATAELCDSRVPAPPPPPPSVERSESGSQSCASPTMARIMAAIEELPEDEREVFNLVRVQGMTQAEAAQVVGVSAKTIQRRVNRALALLSGRLGDLGPALSHPPAEDTA